MVLNAEIASLIEDIKGDKTHGASELARIAAGVLKVAAERSRASTVGDFRQEQRAAGERLMKARPAMATVFNIVSGILDIMSNKAAAMDLGSIKQFTATTVDGAIESSARSVARIAEYAAKLIDEGDTVITHSCSSTVMAALEKADARNSGLEVIVTRSGPGRTGERIARQLVQYEIPVTFIDDAAIGLHVSKADKAMVGADRICVDGQLINGVGTFQLALAAEKAGIPLYVLCETLKFDPRLKGGQVELEDKGPDEVVGPGALPPEVSVKNPYFDITPPELITGVVTENGLLTPMEVISYLEGLLA